MDICAPKMYEMAADIHRYNTYYCNNWFMQMHEMSIKLLNSLNMLIGCLKYFNA